MTDQITITQTELENFQSQLQGQLLDPASAKTLVGDYYQYLDSNGIEYGSLAFDVSQNISNYANATNDVLKEVAADEGVTGSAFTFLQDHYRLDLALADIDARIASLASGSDGFLTERQITDYHYNTLESPGINLPREAFGGALFQEFTDVSWIEVATTGQLDGINLNKLAAAIFVDVLFFFLSY